MRIKIGVKTSYLIRITKSRREEDTLLVFINVIQLGIKNVLKK